MPGQGRIFLDGEKLALRECCGRNQPRTTQISCCHSLPPTHCVTDLVHLRPSLFISLHFAVRARHPIRRYIALWHYTQRRLADVKRGLRMTAPTVAANGLQGWA